MARQQAPYSYRRTEAHSIAAGILIRSHAWWCRAIGPSSRGGNSARTKHIWLTALLVLENGSACFDQGALDVASNLRGKDRSRIQRARNGLLPRPEHLIELATCLLVNQGVRIHEGLIHVPSQEQSVGCPNVLDNGINYV